MQTITISEKRDQAFEVEQGRVYGKCYNYNIKNNINTILEIVYKYVYTQKQLLKIFLKTHSHIILLSLKKGFVKILDVNTELKIRNKLDN